jgi:hypothetical protein
VPYPNTPGRAGEARFAVVSTFVLRKPTQRDSSHYDQIAMEFQPLLDQSPGRRGQVMNNSWLTNSRTSSLRARAIVEM